MSEIPLLRSNFGISLEMRVEKASRDSCSDLFWRYLAGDVRKYYDNWREEPFDCPKCKGTGWEMR